MPCSAIWSPVTFPPRSKSKRMSDPFSGDVYPSDPPAGFVRSEMRGPFSSHNGPYFHKHEEDRFFHGLRVQKRHCNSHGILHGGMMSAFADGLLGTAVWRATRRRAVTVRLTTDFLAMARPGEWLEGTANVVRATKSVAFVEGTVYVGSRTVLTASGVFKLMSTRNA